MKKSNAASSQEGEQAKKGSLFIVSTPIGNHEDITLRALRILKMCDLVLCEELKEGARLLKQYNISKKLETLNEQNEFEKSQEIIEMLLNGTDIALVSDAGTPVFADPGLDLLKKALANNIDIQVVPGVSSIMTALVRSGFGINQFLYAGFLSRMRDERHLQLKYLSEVSSTVVLLETPYRIMPVLEAAASLMPDRKAYIGVNLTMAFETHHYGTFSELYEKFADTKFKGEFVIVFDGAGYHEILNSGDTAYKQGKTSGFGSAGKYERKRDWKDDRERPRGRRDQDQRFRRPAGEGKRDFERYDRKDDRERPRGRWDNDLRFRKPAGEDDRDSERYERKSYSEGYPKYPREGGRRYDDKPRGKSYRERSTDDHDSREDRQYKPRESGSRDYEFRHSDRQKPRGNFSKEGRSDSRRLGFNDKPGFKKSRSSGGSSSSSRHGTFKKGGRKRD